MSEAVIQARVHSLQAYLKAVSTLPTLSELPCVNAVRRPLTEPTVRQFLPSPFATARARAPLPAA
jgi:hypothetical protein